MVLEVVPLLHLRTCLLLVLNILNMSQLVDFKLSGLNPNRAISEQRFTSLSVKRCVSVSESERAIERERECV